MKMRNIILASTAALTTYAVGFGQVLESEANGLRPGDRLTEQRIVFQDLGRCGEHVLWNLSDVEVVDGRYRLRYSHAADSLHDWVAGTEHRTMYYYDQTSAAGIRLAGLENHTTLIHYDEQELWLPLPMQMGDSVGGIYTGRGSYCGSMFIHSFGRYTTKADAMGTLILPSGDTLRDVIRLRTERLSMTRDVVADSLMLRYGIDSMAAMSADTARWLLQQAENSVGATMLRTEVLRWYARGYRYPVLTTHEMTSVGLPDSLSEEGMPSRFTTAFYCPPSAQESMLEDDEVNEVIRKSERVAGSYSGNAADPLSGLAYNASYNPSARRLHVDYCLEADATLSIAFYSLMGDRVYEEAPHAVAAGTYTLDISLGTHAPGFYILTITVNNIPTGETISIQ